MWTCWIVYHHGCDETVQDGLRDRFCPGATRYVASFSSPSRTNLTFSTEQARSHGATPLNLNADPHAAILAATSGRGADAVLEIVGNPSALLLAIDLARIGGVVVSCGVHTQDVAMPCAKLYHKNLRFSFGRCPVRSVFAESLALLKQVSEESPDLLKRFIQKKVQLKDAPEVSPFPFPCSPT